MTHNILFLIKKNFKHEIRSWKYFLLEIVVIVTSILSISIYHFNGSKLNSKLDPKDIEETKFHENVAELDNLKTFRQLTSSKDSNYQLFYTPDNKLIKDIVKEVSQKLELKDAQGFATKREMLKQFNEDNVIGALTFNQITSKNIDLSIHFPSKLRTIRNEKCEERNCFWLSRCLGVLDHNEIGDTTTHGDIYENEGFLTLQHQIFLEWIKSFDLPKYGKIPSVTVNSFEHQTNWETCIMRTSINFIWFFYNFLFFIPFLNLLWKVSREIEEDFPRHYSIYGFSNNQHWIAHCITAFLHLFILDIVIIGFLMIELPYGPNDLFYRYGYLVLFLIFYNIILSLTVFILATLISNAKTSILLGASLWIVGYGIFSAFLENSSTINIHVVLSFLLFSNNFLPFGMVYFEGQSVKGIWEILALQVGAILLYVAILKSVERLRSGRYIRRLKISENSNPILSHDLYWSSFEYGPVESQQLVLKNLYVYKDCQTRREVLKNISMTFFKDEISIILGPRSCGKTTLITVLAGWLNYNGHVYFEGNKELTENSNHYRRFIDVSMCNNALCDLFSVEEQLHYIIAIKSQNSNKTEQKLELNRWLAILKSNISDPRVFVKALNFDQKRLLSLCCLLSGSSRIVLLDEPTLHMTADGQSAYWRILKQEKLNRIIAMTTDSVDEANAIGERIGILNCGSLMAWGTSFHLRSNLSNVIYMVVFISRITSVASITQRMETLIPNLKIHSIFHDRIVYILPANKKSAYQRMFIDLEKEFTLLGIQNIYMTSGDLSNVYMTLTSQKGVKTSLLHISESLKVLNETTPTPKHQLRSALYYKKLLYQAPNIAPVAIMILALILIPIISEMFTNFALNPSIHVGVRTSLNDNNVLKNLDQYKYFELSRVNEMYMNSQAQLTFSFNAYKERLLHNSEIFHTFGAIERKNDTSQINLWINEKIFHSATMTLNLAHNIIFSGLYPNSMNMMVNINNEPIWLPIEHKISLNQMINLQLPLTLGIIMPLTISTFVVALIDERHNHIDILQRIAGATTASLWLTNFVWDYIVYWILTMLYFLVMCIYTIDGFMAGSKLVILMLLGFYGIPSLVLVYLTFLLVGHHRLNGFLKVFLLQMTLGLAAFLVYRQAADEEPVWFYLLMFSPTFALLVGMATVSSENDVRASCRDHCSRISGCNEGNGCSLVPQCCIESFLQWSFPGILPSICFMALSTVALTAIFVGLIIYRNRKMYSTTARIKQMSSVCYPYDDECVVDEKVRISNMNVRTCKGYAVLVDQLEYEIPKREIHVRAISFALENSKCMGIYGPHSSGKSRLIEQLIGTKPIRFGEVYICGNECKTKIREAIRNLGYCPQNNGFIEGATPRQLLTVFFMINGFPESKCYNQLRNISLMLNLRLYMNTRISELPVNIRRRVNIAVALIAQNKVLIFDEPTRGMSSSEKFLIWSVMRQARDQGNAIIFTSQDSMELEELADFIIMVDQGEMLAIESPQCIRKIYTLGLYLEIKLYSDGETLEEMENNLRKDIENLHRFIMFLHSDSELVKRSGTVLKFYLPIESILYSYLFGTLEKNRQRLNIAEYIVSQGSLATAYDNLRNARKQKIRYDKSKLEV